MAWARCPRKEVILNKEGKLLLQVVVGGWVALCGIYPGRTSELDCGVEYGCGLDRHEADRGPLPQAEGARGRGATAKPMMGPGGPGSADKGEETSNVRRKRIA